MTTKAKTPTAPPAIALDGGRFGYITLDNYGPGTPFDSKFGAKPYLSGSWRMRIFQPSEQTLIGASILEEVYSKAGGIKKIFGSDARAKMSELQLKDKELSEKLTEYNYRNATSIFLRQHSAIADGGEINLPQLQSKIQVNEAISAARDGIHQQRWNLMAQAFAILAPAIDRVSVAAREIVEETDRKERETASRYAVQFSPSPILKAFVYFAVVIVPAPVSNYLAGSGFISLETDLEKSWAQWTQEFSAQNAPKPYHFGRQGGASEIEIREQVALNASLANQQRRHAEELDRINRINDAIRNQPR